MIRRQGFTLIELLIVVTIIAILAGAAVPYVQDYVDQARNGRAKADIDEIKRALMLYEVQYGRYQSQTIASLVGPFLTRNLPDPWGNSYVVSDASSTVYSLGADGTPDTGDEVSAEFRPRMAVTRVNFIDRDGDGVPSNGDLLALKVCRPFLSTTDPIAATGLKIFSDNADINADFSSGDVVNDTLVQFTINSFTTSPVLSKSKLQVASPNAILDGASTLARADSLKILYE